MFEQCHSFIGFISFLYVVMSVCMLVSRHDHELSVMRFTSRQISLPVTTTASMPLAFVSYFSPYVTMLYQLCKSPSIHNKINESWNRNSAGRTRSHNIFRRYPKIFKTAHTNQLGMTTKPGYIPNIKTVILHFFKHSRNKVGRDISVGIAPHYRLDGPGIKSEWGARFSAPVQTGSGAHPASHTMCTGSFPGGKAAGTWRWPPTPYSAQVKERVEQYIYSTSGPSWLVIQ